MIVAIDTSSFVAFLQGESGTDVEKIDSALEVGSALMPPVVLTELLSDPKLPKKVSENLSAMPPLHEPLKPTKLKQKYKF